MPKTNRHAARAAQTDLAAQAAPTIRSAQGDPAAPSRLPVRSATRRRLLALIFALCAVSLLLAAGPRAAGAGQYTVAECDRANRGHADAELERRNAGDYGFVFGCAEDERANSLQIRSITGAPRGRHARALWTAPPGSRIVAVSLQARLRSDAGHEARLSLLGSNGAEAGRLATGAERPAPFKSFERRFGGGGRRGFAASLRCVARARCERSQRARTWIRNLRLTIDDRVAPAISATGPLLEPGWRRGEADVRIAAEDAGSGVRAVQVRVNGRPTGAGSSFDCARIPDTGLVSRLRPCDASMQLSTGLDTARPPFADGDNELRLCARDYGKDGRPGCITRVVKADNSPPRISFRADLDRDDPELLRAVATDRHSGLASGTISYRPLAGGAWRELPTTARDGVLRARADSAAEPPGRYLLRATAVDGAGNRASSSRRADGRRMVVRFPLRERSALRAAIGGRRNAQTRYGGRPRLRATLRRPGGRPIAGERVTVSERFAAGSSLTPIERVRRTNARGQISLRLSRGPSRRVVVAYPGSRRFLPARSRALRLTVGGRARLAVSGRRVRAGRPVRFRGRVGSYGAAIPSGKLIELQVRGGGLRRFRTVRQAFRTDRRGRWRMRYRFDRFYVRPARFRFRVRVVPEGDWPYAAPVVSRSRTVVVRP